MFLWCVYLEREDWGVYVIAPSRGKAKAIFFRCSPDTCEYTDIRVQKLKPADGFRERYLDEDCPELEALGVRYMTEDEFYEYLEKMQSMV